MPHDQASLFDLIDLPQPPPEPPAQTTRIHLPRPAAQPAATRTPEGPFPGGPVTATTPAHRPRARLTRWGGAREHASAIAERCADAWWRSHAGSDIDLPCSALAAVCMLRPRPGAADQAVDTLTRLTREDTYRLLNDTWGKFWLARPDLAEFARPVHEWVTGDRLPGNRQLDGVRAVIAAAADTGILDYTDPGDDPDGVCFTHEADVLGNLVQDMRAHGDRNARGEYHTPPGVCDVMARISMPDGVEPGASVHDPAAGTGGMARAVAAWMRELGQDPAQAAWYLNDMDHTASGLSAVNAALWGLGGHVYIGCADCLREPDWHIAAEAKRAGALRHHHDTVGFGMMAARLLIAERNLTAAIEA